MEKTGVTIQPSDDECNFFVFRFSLFFGWCNFSDFYFPPLAVCVCFFLLGGGGSCKSHERCEDSVNFNIGSQVALLTKSTENHSLSIHPQFSGNS